MKTKVFQVIGLPYYIKGCNTITEAAAFAITNRWGVMPCNLVEITEDSIIQSDDTKVIIKTSNNKKYKLVHSNAEDLCEECDLYSFCKTDYPIISSTGQSFNELDDLIIDCISSDNCNVKLVETD